MIVYVVLRNSVDLSGPPPTFAGVGATPEEALKSARLNPSDVHAWINETDVEIRAYFTMLAFDMETSPPSKLNPPNLKRGGGPVR